MAAKFTAMKGQGVRFGGCAAKAASLASGGLCRVREPQTDRVVRFVIAAWMPTEGIVTGYPAKARTAERVIRAAGS